MNDGTTVYELLRDTTVENSFENGSFKPVFQYVINSFPFNIYQILAYLYIDKIFGH